jgi:bifunctional non-homologous end joining protein LigD
MCADKPKTASDRLGKYRSMRSGSGTPEPMGGQPGLFGPRQYVIQKHGATRLHYDFRLEWGGALWSWAVPKGPCLDPKVKRLAVHVEDHPLDYADFEGVIPKGNYGAGPVIVWDWGQWVPLEDPEEGMEKGKLLFELRGYKLGGVWTLVRTAKGPKDWLLIKKPDGFSCDEGTRNPPEDSVFSGRTLEQLQQGLHPRDEIVSQIEGFGARRRKVRPVDIKPMLAEVRDEPFSHADWLYELKYDGFRLMCAKQGADVVLSYRSGFKATALYPDVAKAMAKLPFDNLILDGEVVVLDDGGRPNFQRLQKRAQLRGRSEIMRGINEHPATLFAFDVLAFEPFDLRKVPLLHRKDILRRLLPKAGALRFTDHIEERGADFFEQVSRMGLEGMVAKRKQSPYTFGRSAHWQKVRVEQTGDFAIVGYSSAKGSRVGLGALCLATYNGDEFVYAGRVGTGFSSKQLEELRAKLEPFAADAMSCVGNVPNKSAITWVEPKSVCEVRYKEWTDDHSLRLPVFLRMRDDKEPAECRREAYFDPDLESPKEEVVETDSREVPFTNLDKTFWPEEGYSKGDLIEFYRAVSPWLLPYLRDRPVVLTRYPDGIHGKSFFQKDAPKWIPSWLRTERMWSEHAEREIDYFICDDVDSLLYLINMGTIPLHIWSSRAESLASPDWSILDLDPKGAPFEDVIAVAKCIRKLCDEIGLPTFIKTSGSTGLHILVPLGRQCTYDQSRTLGELLARVVVDRLPTIATIARQVSRREGKVYIDYLQNGHGRLLVSPLCVRPMPKATVSMPIRWSQVTKKLSLDQFTIETVVGKLNKMKVDPVLGVLDERPNLVEALERLAAEL